MAARGATPTFAPLPHRCPLDELLSLYGCCDVFLSLLRSEGFGRSMAEALQLGVDVIATAYGGLSAAVFVGGRRGALSGPAGGVVGTAAGAGGAVEVEGGYGGLRGWPVPAGRALDTAETRMLSCLVLTYY